MKLTLAELSRRMDAARTAGRTAFRADEPCVPALDSTWTALVTDLAVGEGADDIARAWQDGWTSAMADMDRVDGMYAANAAIEAAWASGDRVAFLAAVVEAKRIDKPGWGPCALGELWALAMTLRYRDRSDHVISEAERKAPNYIASLTRDTDAESERCGLSVRIEYRALYEYRTRQAW